MSNSPFIDKTPSFFSAFRIRIGLNADPDPDPDPENLHLYKKFIFLIKTNCNLLRRRRSYRGNLQPFKKDIQNSIT
jgi:hypothetical protein